MISIQPSSHHSIEDWSTWPSQLHQHRVHYEQLCQTHMDFVNCVRQTNQQAVLLRSSPEYKQLRETETIIRNDCIRTFSSLLFFKSAVVQEMVVRLLLIFASNHPTIGYKQGMTDILSILLLCLFCERWRSASLQNEHSSQTNTCNK